MTEQEEFEFRARMEAEDAASENRPTRKQINAQKLGDEAANPLTAGIVGAFGASLAEPVLRGGYNYMSGQSGAGASAGASGRAGAPGQKWAASTGYGEGPGYTVREVSEEYKARRAPIGEGKISSKIAKNQPQNIAAYQEQKAREALEARMRAKSLPLTEKVAARTPESLKKAGRFAYGASQSWPARFAGRAVAGASLGAQGADTYNRFTSGDILGGIVSGLGTLGSGMALVPHPLVRGAGTALAIGAPMLNEYMDRPGGVNNPMAAGGIVGYNRGKKVVEGATAGLDVLKKVFTPKPTKQVKPSEALGPHYGKKLGLTQTDNFGVHEGRMGGNQFPNFQNISPLHAKDRVVWMNDSEKHANDMVKNSRYGDKDVIFSTYIGAPDQLKSNKTVNADIVDRFYKQVLPNLNNDQIDLINNRIATLRKGKDKSLVFSQPFDIRDKFAVQELGQDTFDRRGALSSLLGQGEGVGKTKGGIFLPEYQDILRSHRDPLTEGVPTSSIGTRLFSVDPIPSKFSTEYHPDYNWAVYGQDMGVQFAPFSQKFLDWYKRTEAKAPGKNRTHGNAWFSYMKDPQDINHEFLMSLDKAGLKTGGLV